MKKNILVTGGTGKTGRRVASLLTQQHHGVRIGSRNGDPAFDWNDPDTYTQALEGIQRAYMVYYPDLAVPGAKQAIRRFTEAALQQGLEKVVLLSGKGEKEAEACEAIVAGSGLNYTVVRASWFNQNFSESFLLEPILAGEVALPMTNAAIPFVDVHDIAEVVAKVLLDDQYNGQTITLTGSRKLTFREAIAEIAAGSGRDISFQALSPNEYQEVLKAAGIPDDYVWLLNYLFKEVLGNPENQEISYDIESVLGRSATDFGDYVRDTAITGTWNQPVVQSL